jgi:hypothetical protein
MTELLTHTCAQCGMVVQFNPSGAGLLFKCPGCGAKGELPAPRPEDVIVQQQLDEVARQQKKDRQKRQRWRKIRRGLTVLGFSALVDLAAVSIGLLAFAHSWLSWLYDWPLGGASAAVAGSIALALGVANGAALVGYRLAGAGTRSTPLQPWLLAALAAGVGRSLGCLVGGMVLILFGETHGGWGLRVGVLLSGVGLAAQWVAQIVFLRAVARALSCTWLMRSASNLLFLVGGTFFAGGVLVLWRPLASAGTTSGEDWILRLLFASAGLLVTISTWFCFAWSLRIVHAVRNAIEK